MVRSIAAVAANFATAMKLNFPVTVDPRQKIANAYEVDGIPTMFVIDKSGKVLSGHAGFDMTTEFRLASELGIKPRTTTEGAADGDTSH